MDPVLEFILKRETHDTAIDTGNAGPWSRLSATRLSYIGYELIKQRYRELGVPEPSRQEAEKLQREARA